MTSKRTYSTEDFFGAILLIAGLFALGVFNFKSDEPLVEAGLKAQSGAIVAQTVHGLNAKVEGRHITLSGLADTPQEKAQVLKALRALEGRGRVRSEVEVLEPATPFVVTALHTEEAPMTFEGTVPTEALRRALRGDFGTGVDALTLASGMPDAEWPAVLQTGLRALVELETGRLVLEGRQITLSGTALTPAHVERTDLLMADLPDGYAFQSNLDLRDDGTALRLTAARNDGVRADMTGKVPADLAEQIGDSTLEISPLALPVEEWDAGVLLALEALDQLQSGYLSITGSALTLTGEAWSQQAFDAANALLDRLPRDMSVTRQVVLADTGAPFGLRLSLSQTGVIAQGKVPQSLAPRVLAALTDAPLNASALKIARISPGLVWWDAASLGAEALRYFEAAELEFDGTELKLSGIVQDPSRLELLEDHLDALPDEVELTLDVTLIDDGSPLRMELSYDGESAVLTGKLPTSLRVDQFAAPVGAPVLTGDLVQTPKPGPSDWSETMLASAELLSFMERGTVSVLGRAVDVQGVLRDPKREERVLQVLAALPEAYTVTTSFTFQDDGRPFGFSLVFDGRRGVLTGKVPLDLGPSSQAAILGFPIEAGSLYFAEISADAEWWIAARSGLKALAVLDKGTLTLDAHQITLAGLTTHPDKAEEARARVRSFEGEFKVTVDVIVE